MTDIFMPDFENGPIPQRWADAAASIGCSITRTPQQKVVCLRDIDAIYASGLDIDFISKENLRILLDRTRYHETGVPVIPSVVPLTIDDLSAFGDVPLFIKPSCTYHVPVGALKKLNNRGLPGGYTHWQSPTAAAEGLSQQFWDYQQSPDYLGPLVVQPSCGEKVDMYVADVAINANNEVYLYESAIAMQIHGFYREDSIDSIRMPDDCMQHIRDIATLLNIRGGVHCVQFIEYNGQLCLMDWNPRAAGYFDILEKPGQLAAALSHVVGLEATYDPYSTVLRQEIYRDEDISPEQIAIAVGMGFRARTTPYLGSTRPLDALAYIGSSAEECKQKFQELYAAW